MDAMSSWKRGPVARVVSISALALVLFSGVSCDDDPKPSPVDGGAPTDTLTPRPDVPVVTDTGGTIDPPIPSPDGTDTPAPSPDVTPSDMVATDTTTPPADTGTPADTAPACGGTGQPC